MKKFFLILLAAVTSLTLVSCSDVENVAEGTKEEPIKIIAAHNQTSSESPYQAGLLKFKEVAEEASDGRIEVEVHAGTIVTEEPELVQKLMVGAADVVLVSSGFLTLTGIPDFDCFV